MPLRVSDCYDEPDVVNKKAHKMSHKGHYQKVRRPTNLEVYNDAAKILEELLEKRADPNLRPQRQRRNKTEQIVSTIKEPDNPVARSQTMPSKYRASPNDDAKKRELEAILKKEEKIEKQAENGFVSSADTEGEEDGSDPLSKRKKKSLFKLAKERLIHTFNRDQKKGFARVKDKSDSPKRRKPRKRSERAADDVVSESSRHIKAHLHKDKSIDYTEEVEIRTNSGSRDNGIHHRNSRSSSFSRTSLINTIKRPFRKLDRQSSKQEDDSHIHPQAPSAPRSPPTTLDGIPSPSQHCVGKGSSSSKSPSPTSTFEPSQTVVEGHVGQPFALSSSSSVLPMSDHNSVGSLNILPSIQSNVLDSPGEDIEFMDMEETRMEDGGMLVRASSTRGIKFHTSEGLLNFNWLADQAADKAKVLEYEIEETSVSRLRPDGDMETTTTVTAMRTIVMQDVPEVEEHDFADGAEEDDKPSDKEELYGKIAQKLIAMADTYGTSMSDPETMGAMAAAPIDAPLTDLEKEIIACLRSKDKYSQELEDKIKEVTTSTVDDAYQRFRSTIQNSLGTELSWNHLAFLFYSTKGVVSAMGKGSQAATQAKNFTLQYISDTFASWIMDQGGFDSMLSSSESDPEVD